MKRERAERERRIEQKRRTGKIKGVKKGIETEGTKDQGASPDKLTTGNKERDNDDQNKKGIPKLKIAIACLPYIVYWWWLNRTNKAKVREELESSLIGPLPSQVDHLIRTCKLTSFDVARLWAQLQQRATEAPITGGVVSLLGRGHKELSPDVWASVIHELVIKCRGKREREYKRWIAEQDALVDAEKDSKMEEERGDEEEWEEENAHTSRNEEEEDNDENHDGEEEDEFYYEEDDLTPLEDWETSRDFAQEGPDQDDKTELRAWELLCLLTALPCDNIRKGMEDDRNILTVVRGKKLGVLLRQHAEPKL